MERLGKEHGLGYHAPYALVGDKMVGLRGKRVLEVGGSLPRGFVLDDLGAACWHSVEEMAYWEESQASGPATGSRPQDVPTLTVAFDGDLDAVGRHAVFQGGVEDLSAAFDGRYDVIFSIAAFEHILDLPRALERMHAVLRPGGKLFTMFSPVWSAHDGHHLPVVRSEDGREFSVDESPIPPWGHLLYEPPELFRHLSEQVDPRTAAEIIHYVYQSSHINRLFVEDYARMFQAGPFHVETVQATYPREVPADVQAALEQRWPGHTVFGYNGVLAVLVRPEQGEGAAPADR